MTEIVSDVFCGFKVPPALGALATLDVLACLIWLIWLICWDADGWTRTAFEAAGWTGCDVGIKAAVAGWTGTDVGIKAAAAVWTGTDAGIEWAVGSEVTAAADVKERGATGSDTDGKAGAIMVDVDVRGL